MSSTVRTTWLRWMRAGLGVGVLIAHCVFPMTSLAEHPVDVQRLTVEGDYFHAMSVYELLPDRQLDQDTHIAAAKSAWALGLTKQATALFDAVLRGTTISSDERARITLSRAAIEYQEERYQEAALFAEKAASYLPERSPLRGRALLLEGQSLMKLNAYSTAEDKLLRALADTSLADRPEVAFALGAVQVKLGKITNAERSFKAIPTDHPRASLAVKALAGISLQSEQSDRARFWIERGRDNYPEAFLDSWADYGLTKVALDSGDITRAREVVGKAAKRYPPSDAWLILMQAALEQAEWNKAGEERQE